jgi:2-oxoglutarate ferredoxin oxidoreductase subunit beta
MTKSTPFGSIENPIHPISFAIAAEATFVARTIDVDSAHLQEILKRAAMHKGIAFVEILQNCNIFNDGAWDDVSDKSRRSDNVVVLEQGKPLIYGANRDKAIRITGFSLESVKTGPDGVPESDLPLHDEHTAHSMWAFQLSRMEQIGLPTPIGVFRAVEEPTYDELLETQVQDAREHGSRDLLRKLLYSGQRWTVGGNGSGGGN